MRGTKPQLRIDPEAIADLAAPDWLTADARGEWERVMPVLADRKILTTADLGSLENYCVAIGQVREMQRHIDQHGAIFEAFKEGRDGTMLCLGLRRNPAVGIQSDAMTRAQRLAAELGLTPVSRSRPAVRGDDDADSLVD